MDFQKSFLIFNLLLATQFVILTFALELHKMSSEDYVNYINPHAVHKYQHENGDTILCVNYEDQISLNSDKTYGHKKKDLGKNWMDGNLSSSLSKKCPKGTVHVREIKHEDVKRAGSVARFISIKFEDDDNYDKKYALASMIFGAVDIEGATAVMNVWQSYLDPVDLLSRGFMRIGVETPDEKPVQIIEAGWQVYSTFYGSPIPRFFLRWTADSYNDTGCYDLFCSGFVMAKDAPLYFGQPLTNVSVYGDESKQVELDISIKYEARNPPAWVVYVSSKEVGYLPASRVPDILPNLNTAKWGGEVWVSKKNQPTKTDMGSGRFPLRGYPNAAYVRNMSLLVGDGMTFNGGMFQYFQNSPHCYRVTFTGGPSKWNNYIFYGGPGADDVLCNSSTAPPPL